VADEIDPVKTDSVNAHGFFEPPATRPWPEGHGRMVGVIAACVVVVFAGAIIFGFLAR
jgi:hypothetical protein